MESGQCGACILDHPKLKVEIKQKNRFNFSKRFFFISVKCLINHSTFSIIYLSILSTLVVQQTI
jgi:hypothetical protein